MGAKKKSSIAALMIAVGSPLILAESAFAESDGKAQIEHFLKDVISTMASFVTVIGVICIIIGGYIYMTSAGNPDKLEKGKSTIKWTIFGMALVLGALAVTNMIISTAKNSFTG